MYITSNLLNSIVELLKLSGIKDSLLDVITSLNAEDFVTMLLNNNNVKTSLSTLLTYIDANSKSAETIANLEKTETVLNKIIEYNNTAKTPIKLPIAIDTINSINNLILNGDTTFTLDDVTLLNNIYLGTIGNEVKLLTNVVNKNVIIDLGSTSITKYNIAIIDGLPITILTRPVVNFIDITKPLNAALSNNALLNTNETMLINFSRNETNIPDNTKIVIANLGNKKYSISNTDYLFGSLIFNVIADYDYERSKIGYFITDIINPSGEVKKLIVKTTNTLGYPTITEIKVL